MLSKAHSASRRETVLIASLTALVLLAWYALWIWGRSPYGHLLLHGPTHLRAVTERPWLLATMFVTGWTVMTVAMMLPTSFPMILLFRRTLGNRTTAAWLVTLLITGYLAIWLLCGVLLQLVNWLLHAGIGRLPLPPNAQWITAAVILTIAGLYQFSSLKYACLEKCRTPLSFLMSHWRGGNESAQALRLGVEHGLFCVGCCWSLMLLMFLVNAGSLVWMLLLGAVMALEKNFSWGRRLSTSIGVLLLIATAAVVVQGVRS
jgi:predicted metal-binding membrane protein